LNFAKGKERDLVKMQSMKETASNIAASAKSGMDKTKATLEEKVTELWLLLIY